MTKDEIAEISHGLNWIIRECDEITHELGSEPAEVRNIRLAVSGIGTLLICERMKNETA